MLVRPASSIEEATNLMILSQERFIEWVNTHENVRWVPMIEMARDFRRKNKPAQGAKMPFGYRDSENSKA